MTTTALSERRSALIHFLAAAGATILPFLGATSLPTPVQVAQILAGLLGAVGTYRKGGRGFKIAIPFATAVVVGLIPYLDGGWGELNGAALYVALIHVAAGVGVGLFPNESAVAPLGPDGAHLVTSLPGGVTAAASTTPTSGDRPAPEVSGGYKFGS